jgi:hypothetical protein
VQPACAWPDLSTYKVPLSVVLGAIIYWARSGRGGRRSVRMLPLRSLTQLIPNVALREAVDFVIFVAMGCVLVWLLATPNTPQQGFAAGAGWTGLASEAMK